MRRKDKRILITKREKLITKREKLITKRGRELREESAI